MNDFKKKNDFFTHNKVYLIEAINVVEWCSSSAPLRGREWETTEQNDIKTVNVKQN